jgi:hypothetical protein
MGSTAGARSPRPTGLSRLRRCNDDKSDDHNRDRSLRSPAFQLRGERLDVPPADLEQVELMVVGAADRWPLRTIVGSISRIALSSLANSPQSVLWSHGESTVAQKTCPSPQFLVGQLSRVLRYG